MKKLLQFGAVLALGVTAMASSASAQALVPTEYLRNGDQVIVVFRDDGKLYCRRTEDNFEMCHGMEEQADGSFAGPNMKHPDMPKFMTFKGTVIFRETGLSIEGCVLGGVCAAEEWTLK